MNLNYFQIFAVPKYDSKVSVTILQNGIKSSDFLVSDDNCTHRLVGLRYDSKTMHEPEITIVCARHEMAAAKQIAFSLGKRIYQKSALSAILFHYYNSGQKIRYQDYNEVAKVYASFLYSQKN
ncbi:MAG: EscU/YscU/HrcU family type III secretion system export apparatus switch protein [Treponema sp.]|nr:EscU/YscU/HrcU family type III secretion system export apparatus switch protein [Treponema sp.]